MDLKGLLPKDKHDIQAVERCISIGFPKIIQILPELLTWIQDMNWPVAKLLAPFLSTIADHLETEIRTILQGGDETWKYSLMTEIIVNSSQLRANLNDELLRLAEKPTESEQIEKLDLIAMDILRK
ncbi:MAG: DUF5071 domain-containing protein [Balneolaceae bacterium]